jgi:hypothetical protein
MYYKLIRGGVIFDAGEMWLRWQPKNRIMLRCEPSEAQFVMGRDETIYRVQWLNPAPAEAGRYEVIEAAIIDRQEYDDLRAVLDDGETVPVPEPVTPEPEPVPEPEPEQPETERPMTVQEMRQRIADLTAALDMLLKGVTDDA